MHGQLKRRRRHASAGTGDDLSITYVHDPAGGIVQRTLSDPDYAWAPTTGATAYANDGLNRVTAVGGAATTYDSRKNLTQAPGTPTTVYDPLNQLWYAATTRIWYEPLGRLYLTYDHGNTADHRYHAYDGQQRVTDYDGATDALLRRHVPGAGLDDVVATVAADGARTWLTGDERGSVMALSNGSGAVTQVNAWDEYGVPRPGNAGTFQYTGQVWLGFAGMQHSRARAYDPSLGRFRQTDPIGYAAGANLYAYVGGDPVNRVDPLGLDPRSPRRSGCITISGAGLPRSDTWCPPATGLPHNIQILSFGDFDPFAPDLGSGLSGREGGAGAGQDPHEYGVRFLVCLDFQPGCTNERVWTCLLRNPAPGATGLAHPVRNGQTSSIDVRFLDVIGLVRGEVQHIVEPSQRLLINDTMPNHDLFPGQVFREVISWSPWGRYGPRGIAIQNTGVGSGSNGQLNNFLSPVVWAENNNSIKNCVLYRA